MAHLLKTAPKNLLRRLPLLKSHQALSTKPAIKEDSEDVTSSSSKTQDALKASQRLQDIYRKKTIKKPQKPPFVKNLFLNEFDTDILTYPEPIDREQMKALDHTTDSLQAYLNNNKDVDIDGPEFQKVAQQLHLFGMQVDQHNGGRGYGISEAAKVSELLAQSHSNIGLFTSEHLGLQILLKFASEQLLSKYLEDILNGKCKIAFCLAEESGFDAFNLKTTADFDAHKNHWVLNGEKHFVINGNSADLYIVFAKTKKEAVALGEFITTAFCVEKSFGIISPTKSNSTGLKGTDIATVKFENVHVPSENVLVKPHMAYKVLNGVLPHFRLMNGIACAEINKKVVDGLLEHCLKENTSSNKILENDLVLNKLSRIAMRTYVLESMNYLTSSLMDEYEKQDVESESLIVKLYGALSAQENTLDAMQIIGMPAYLEDHWCNILNKDALIYSLIPETLDSVTILIGLQGMVHSGIAIQEAVTKSRNPLLYPTYIFKEMWQNKWDRMDLPVLKKNLHHFVHPSALTSAKCLEYAVARLGYATKTLLSEHGAEIVTRYNELYSLGQCALDIYAMTAALGRASRSYCIGLRHCDNEFRMAQVFCSEASERVKQRVMLLDQGPFANRVEAHKKLGTKLFEVGKYFAEHPLTRNY